MKTVIKLAKTAGFCFGVKRAVDIVEGLLDEGKAVATLGPIIHNPQMVERLEKKGCEIVDNPIDAKSEQTLVIRSHGVSRSVYDTLDQKEQQYIDATCPFVAKIHRIVANAKEQNAIVLIAGDPKHPEVIGIKGHCSTEAHVYESPKDLEFLLRNLGEKVNKPIIMVAQTTYNVNLWGESAEISKKYCTNLKIYDTICSATSARQQEAISLAKESDLMVVIGGRESSNTQKLRSICEKECDTVLVQTAAEIDPQLLVGRRQIGVTAGASTPAYIIKEAIYAMDEMLMNNLEEEMDFAQLLDQYQDNARLYVGKKVRGFVVQVAPNEVHVDIGAKQSGVVSADELTDDPTLSTDEIVKIGDEIDLMVLKVNDQDGLVMLSKKRCDAQAGFEAVREAYEAGTILDGVVTDVVKSGVLVLTNKTKIFVPASHAAMQKVEDLSTLLKKQVKIKILEINDKRGRALASIKAAEREVFAEERKAAEEKFWAEAELGKRYSGEVKSLTEYGAFVDLGGVDGMIHRSELSWTKRVRKASDVLKVGDVVEVYIRELDAEKKRISLGYRKQEDNPWEILRNTYNVGDTAKVTVVSFTDYGAFAKVIPGIDGLIHISQIANQRVEKIADFLQIGQEVDVQIIDIDYDKKRVSLSIRNLLADEEPAAEEADAE